MICPICQSTLPPRQDNRFHPMCSERCQLVDLGNWLDGNYAIPDEPCVDGPAPFSRLSDFADE